MTKIAVDLTHAQHLAERGFKLVPLAAGTLANDQKRDPQARGSELPLNTMTILQCETRTSNGFGEFLSAVSLTARAEPGYLAPDFDGIPPELKALPRWVAWQAVKRGGKDTKVPYVPSSFDNSLASVSDPATWGTFEQAEAAYLEGDRTGVGFVLNADGIVGIDLDECIDRDGVFDPAAMAIMDRAGAAYVELSPSGTGLRAFGYATALPKGRSGVVDGIKCELYSGGRYLTVTGRPIRRGSLVQLHGFEALANAIGTAAKVNPDTGERVQATGAQKHAELVARILSGDVYHDSLRDLAASMVATGMHDGSVVNHLRSLMDNSTAPKDDRWRSRFAEIPALVKSASGKFAPLAIGQPDRLPEPTDLFTSAMPAPFPIRASMPAVLADWVEMQVQATGLDAAGFAVATLAVLSGASDRTVRVRLGPTHVSSCVLWAALLGDTGAGKSPCMETAIEPLKRIDADLSRLYAERLQEHLADPKHTEKPVRQMHVLADATVEAVVRKLHESDGHRVLRHVDEGSGWLNAMGRYAAAGKSDGERGTYLTGWVGPHDHTVVRIERGDLLVPELGIAMLFGITPAKVKEGFQEASEEGLLARCLTVLLDRAKHRHPDRAVFPGPASAAYASIVRRVSRASGEIALSEDAQVLFDAWRSECRELGAALAHVSPGLSAVLAKLAENTGRIAALYSLCTDRVDGSVHIEQMAQAVAMARALLGHAKVLYRDVLAAGTATELERDLAERILRQNAGRIARRDLRTARWESADEATRRAAIDMLGTDRWLLAEDTKRVRSGTRFSEATAWIVNPLVLDGRFADVRQASVNKANAALAALAKL
jgi:hypothetical protein